MEQEDLKRILELHKKWIRCEEGGQRANLQGVDLRGVNLRGANLRYANLQGTNLQGVNLQGADLQGARLREANLRGANIIIIHGPRHTLYATSTHIQIGCEKHSPEYWLEYYSQIGEAYCYEDVEIEMYGDMIKLAAKHLKQKREEKWNNKS